MIRNGWFILCLILGACSMVEKSNVSNERYMASLGSQPVNHRPFFIIRYDRQVQDTRLNKEQTTKLINKSTSKDCAGAFLKEVASIFHSQEIKERINALYDDYKVEIHLGGIYHDNNGKISFDQIVQAHVPNTDYHKTNQYLYQVRAVGEKNPDKFESILENSEQYEIEFLSPNCEVDRLKISAYEEMLKVISANIQSAIKMLNENRIKDSSTNEILEKFF